MKYFGLALGSIAATVLAVVAAPGCGGDDGSVFGPGGGNNNNNNGDSGCVGFGCSSNEGGKPGCVGVECSVVDCNGQAAKTTLTGTVFDPAGKVPLYNVVVYVAREATQPITLGLGPKCDTCAGSVSGNPFAITTTDTKGNFKLEDVPAGANFSLVMQIGKWRRIVPIPALNACQVTPLDPALTRLPRNRTEGDIPRIALTTGSADALECLLKKVGLDDSEFGLDGEARVHLYKGQSTPPGKATSALAAGGSFKDATTLWGSLEALKKYDIVILSCEGGEHEKQKPVEARQALYDYAKVGGRIFTSHYHHYWFSNSPVAAVKGLASWVNDYTCSPLGLPGQGGPCPVEKEPAPTATVEATLNTSFAKGAAMKEWLRNTQSLTMPGETLPIQEMRHNVNSVTTNALSWMTVQNPEANKKVAHEYITFNTPVGAPDDQVCGRVVYSDLHVGAGDVPGNAFPTECKTTELTPQQKALEFMLFDLSSCIQKDDKPPVLPK